MTKNIQVVYLDRNYDGKRSIIIIIERHITKNLYVV
jgi:hypothetical protein